jgi:hypothetical protein
MTPTGKRTRELAERTSNGTLVRLFWLEGTRELWVEVCEPEFDVTFVIPAQPEHALLRLSPPLCLRCRRSANSRLRRFVDIGLRSVLRGRKPLTRRTVRP